MYRLFAALFRKGVYASVVRAFWLLIGYKHLCHVIRRLRRPRLAGKAVAPDLPKEVAKHGQTAQEAAFIIVCCQWPKEWEELLLLKPAFICQLSFAAMCSLCPLFPFHPQDVAFNATYRRNWREFLTWITDWLKRTYWCNLKNTMWYFSIRHVLPFNLIKILHSIFTFSLVRCLEFDMCCLSSPWPYISHGTVFFSAFQDQ